MKKKISKIIEILSTVAFFIIAEVCITHPSMIKYLYEGKSASNFQQEPFKVLNEHNVVWWDNIGGCGVGGGNGAAGGAARWVGRGVTGGIVDLELLSHKSIGGDYVYDNFIPKISYNLSELNAVSITIPFTTKNSNYKIEDATLNETVGGLGNLSIEYLRKYGKTHAGNLILQLGVPTGKYNHRRDTDPTGANKMYVVPELQSGNGLFSLSLGTQYNLDKDWGMIMFGGTYTAMTAEFEDFFKSGRHWGASNDLFSDKNLKKNNDFSGYEEANKYHVLFHEPALYEYSNYSDFVSDSAAYAAGFGTYANKGNVTLTHKYYTKDTNNNLSHERINGDFYGDVINLFIAVGLVQEKCVHSISIDYSQKLHPDWYVRSNYGEIVQNDYLGLIKQHYLTKIIRENTTRLWNLSYGLEISSLYFPVFIAGTLTLDGTGNAEGYTGTVGIKGSFF